MGTKRGKGWLKEEPTARMAGWRIPEEVIQAVTAVKRGKETEERLVTTWLREKIAQRRKGKK